MEDKLNIKKFNSPYSFYLMLSIDSDKKYDLWLPKEPEGFFHFGDNQYLRFISVLAKNDEWYVSCKKPSFIRNVPLEQCYDIPIKDCQLLEVENDDRLYVLYIERVHEDALIFNKYHLISNVEITIGNNEKNDIYYNNPFVSSIHAKLIKNSDQWVIIDNNSEYGTYINGKRKDKCSLKLGDVITIMGLKIIIGINNISINKANQININNRIIKQDSLNFNGYSNYYGQEISDLDIIYFNRLPRKHIKEIEKTITVEGPPMSMDRAQMPLMLRMGSSMVMGGSAALAGNITTVLSSLVFPLLSSKYTDKQKKEYEKKRTEKYTEYLEFKKNEIISCCNEEHIFFNDKYLSVAEIIHHSNDKNRMWERRPSDDDFLNIRLGTGSKIMNAKIDYPQRRFELEPDELEEKMYELVEKEYYVDDSPISLSLVDNNLCGIVGNKDLVMEYIQTLLIQLTYLHSYDELKIIFLIEKDDLEKIDYIRYLPHLWDNYRSNRYIATNESEAYVIGEFIQSELEKQKEEDLKQTLKNRPYYLIFALNKKLLESHDVMKEIIQKDKNCGISFIFAFDNLPKETKKIIELVRDNECKCISMDITEEDQKFAYEKIDSKDKMSITSMLANTELKFASQSLTLPKMVTFLEMFKVGCVEQLNTLKRWKENNPVKSLSVPVGIATDGSLFTLNLHEKNQGPHGLVAGMTGSGKSEFIITYILSLAVNFHPDEVAFVLIDYKGGGLTGAFENPQTGVRLPHLAGTITNLDGGSIQRSLISLESEMIRRQKKFNEVKSIVNEGTMDIYSYQKLYREGIVDEPMPHLFIISDEFAELKQQQPEFMAKLISIARIGRSLGVHLILATQKPSGVVDDQIRSNTKFRVCLRVQDKSDSMDMLKRPDAAELTDTGRFYLQVGYNEFFALGQSAWCGAAYEPQETMLVQKDDAIEFIDVVGQTVLKTKNKVKKVNTGTKQIVAIVKYLSDLATLQNIKVRQLCQPELSKLVDINELNEVNNQSMKINLGLLDDPGNQVQFPLEFDFLTKQNLLIVGGNGSGKTTIVQNILYILSKKLSPDDLNYYILDYSSRMLKLFNKLPHCGAVLCEEESDSLDEFFKIINSIIDERKKLFSQLEVDDFESARKIKKIPLILVVIDNISGLSTSKKGESITYNLSSYIKNSANYGVKYIITCSHQNEVSSKIKLELPERICLHLNDKYAYSEIINSKVEFLPINTPGRGLCNIEGRTLEFQSAIVNTHMNEKDRINYLKDEIKILCNECSYQTEALHLPVIDEKAEYEDFARQFKKGRIPIGYSKKDGKPVALPLKQFSGLSIYIGNDLGKKTIIDNFIYASKKENMEIWFLKSSDYSVVDTNDNEDLYENVRVFDLNENSLIELRTLLIQTVEERKSLINEYCIKNNIDLNDENRYKKSFDFLQSNTKPIMLIFENYAEFCESVDIMSTLMFLGALKNTRVNNIYPIGYFYPNDNININNRTLYYGFNTNGNTLLFGGKYDLQDICIMPNTQVLEKTLPYNLALMKYRDSFHVILMPCGEVETKEIDEDEKSIFS